MHMTGTSGSCDKNAEQRMVKYARSADKGTEGVWHTKIIMHVRGEEKMAWCNISMMATTTCRWLNIPEVQTKALGGVWHTIVITHVGDGKNMTPA